MSWLPLECPQIHCIEVISCIKRVHVSAIMICEIKDIVFPTAEQ